jgi:hypothetical protein
VNDRASAAPLAGLSLAPAITLVAGVIAPRIPMPEAAAAAVAFAGARATLTTRRALALAAGGLALLAVAVVAAPRPLLGASIVNLALVAIAHAAGASIGRRVAHPGHLLPACAVAAAADLVSVIHPSGPTRAIVENERALALFAIGFPVPGTRAIAPSIGFGDFVFLALVLGVAAVHGLSIVRAALSGAIGLAVAGLVAARFAVPIPALVPIGAAVVLGLPEARRLRREDARTTRVAIAIAAAVVVGVLIRGR